MRADRAAVGGLTAKAYGESRFDKSDKGWPIVDISQLDGPIVSYVQQGYVRGVCLERLMRLTLGYQLLEARSYDTQDCRSCSHHESVFPDLAVASSDPEGTLQYRRSVVSFRQAYSSLHQLLVLVMMR